MSAEPLHIRARRRSGTMLMESMFRGMSKIGRAHPRARRAFGRVELVPDIPYLHTGMEEHLLDIYRPPGPGPHPVVLYLHGGGFKILSKDTHWAMVLQYAARGYLVFNANYRLAPKYPFPAALEDACAAYEWVVQNAARYGGDLSRLVLAGESAGGNLVTALTATTCYERPESYAQRVWETQRVPDAVIAACGLLQVSDCDRFARRKRLSPFVSDRIVECERAYLGEARADLRARPGALDLADPLCLIEGSAPARPLPPFFAPVGTKDPLLDDTRRLAEALEGHGVRCEARYYEGEIHAFHAFVWRAKARRCWVETFDFLLDILEAPG